MVSISQSSPLPARTQFLKFPVIPSLTTCSCKVTLTLVLKGFRSTEALFCYGWLTLKCPVTAITGESAEGHSSPIRLGTTMQK